MASGATKKKSRVKQELALAETPTMGRMEKKRRRTRARLLEAAYAIMSQSGVDAAKIQDVTEYADVGFGTFYNYFKSKDDLASQVLDCVIDDFGRRNVEATREIRASNPALVMPISIRLVMREAMRSPMWQWWALRPDLLVDRMTKGFGPFGLRDLEDGITRKILKISREDVEASWTLLMWVKVGAIHDVVVGDSAPDCDVFVVESMMRMLGVSANKAHLISSTDLPKYPRPKINWYFDIEASQDS